MEKKLKSLIEELKVIGKETLPYTNKRERDPEAKVNAWYVLSHMEEALLSGTKSASMSNALQKLIAEIKKGATKFISVDPDPNAKVNVWYVVARLQDVLLAGKE